MPLLNRIRSRFYRIAKHCQSAFKVSYRNSLPARAEIVREVHPGRRKLIKALPFVPFAGSAFAQQATPVAVRKLHFFDIRVTDVARSLRFYQDLFAAPIQARVGESVLLRIGAGPRFFSLTPVAEGEQPGFHHIGLSVANFDLSRVQDELTAFGVMPAREPVSGASPLDLAMQSWASNGQLFFADAEGIRYQLADESYCGGGGVLGNDCQELEAVPGNGMFELVDISHFTTFLANRDRANDFYTRAFGKQFQAYQGPNSPVIGVGDGIQFLMYVGGNQPGTPTNPGRIDHVSFTMNNFSVDGILARLTDYGLRPRTDPNDTQALMHWVSMRMPNRGGAEGGTPEVYFSDPDGIRIQLQDPGYCGGSGYLGDQCPPLDGSQ